MDETERRRRGELCHHLLDAGPEYDPELGAPAGGPRMPIAHKAMTAGDSEVGQGDAQRTAKRRQSRP